MCMHTVQEWEQNHRSVGSGHTCMCMIQEWEQNHLQCREWTHIHVHGSGMGTEPLQCREWVYMHVHGSGIGTEPLQSRKWTHGACTRFRDGGNRTTAVQGVDTCPCTWFRNGNKEQMDTPVHLSTGENTEYLMFTNNLMQQIPQLIAHPTQTSTQCTRTYKTWHLQPQITNNINS